MGRPRFGVCFVFLFAKTAAAGSHWFYCSLPSTLVEIFPAIVCPVLLSHHCCWTFILNKPGWCVRDWFSTYLQEKREKQVWNKRRQILYTVEKVGIRALCILKTSKIKVYEPNMMNPYYMFDSFCPPLTSFRSTAYCWRYKTLRSILYKLQRRTGRLCLNSIKQTLRSCATRCWKKSGKTGKRYIWWRFFTRNPCSQDFIGRPHCCFGWCCARIKLCKVTTCEKSHICDFVWWNGSRA